MANTFASFFCVRLILDVTGLLVCARHDGATNFASGTWCFQRYPLNLLSTTMLLCCQCHIRVHTIVDGGIKAVLDNTGQINLATLSVSPTTAHTRQIGISYHSRRLPAGSHARVSLVDGRRARKQSPRTFPFLLLDYCCEFPVRIKSLLCKGTARECTRAIPVWRIGKYCACMHALNMD